MARIELNIALFNGGIAESLKRGSAGACRFIKRVNTLDEPTQMSAMPTTSKVSATTVTDLVKWIVSGTPYDSNTYAIGDTGRFYKIDSGGTWSLIKTVSNCKGQGLELYNDYLYYTQNTQIGRYGPLSGAPAATDNWNTGLTDTSGTGIGPIKVFKEGFAVAHGPYVAWYDGSTFTVRRLSFPPDIYTRCISPLDEYLVFGVSKGTSLTASEQGLLFYWDGSATTFNFFAEVNVGGVYSMTNYRNRLMFVAGGYGDLYAISAGGYTSPQRLERLPNITMGNTVEIASGAMTTYKGQLYIGGGLSTNTTSFIHGAYRYGSLVDSYPEGLYYDATISTGTETGTSVSIGAVKGIGSALYIAWKDGSTYGVDKLTDSNSAVATYSYESLLIDGGRPTKIKKLLKLVVTHSALASGQSIALGYDINRSGSYTATTNNTVGTTETSFDLTVNGSTVFYDVGVRVLATTNSSALSVYAIAVVYDDQSEQIEGTGNGTF